MEDGECRVRWRKDSELPLPQAPKRSLFCAGTGLFGDEREEVTYVRRTPRIVGFHLEGEGNRDQ